MCYVACFFLFFFFNDTATTEIYTLSLHDALPICDPGRCEAARSVRSPADLRAPRRRRARPLRRARRHAAAGRSEEHTSELQSQSNLVCRLLLEKKKEGSRVGGARHLREVGRRRSR